MPTFSQRYSLRNLRKSISIKFLLFPRFPFSDNSNMATSQFPEHTDFVEGQSYEAYSRNRGLDLCKRETSIRLHIVMEYFLRKGHLT